jgi:hypothetical protein
VRRAVASLSAATAYFREQEAGLPQLFFNSLRPAPPLRHLVADGFGSAVPVNELKQLLSSAAIRE